MDLLVQALDVGAEGPDRGAGGGDQGVERGDLRLRQVERADQDLRPGDEQGERLVLALVLGEGRHGGEGEQGDESEADQSLRMHASPPSGTTNWT
ncbi:MAG TPA: hypothetical protein VN783_05825 [Thermoanaerobaculia bacterium]|nr:hypothetical protein [Thermoanaerobaculia bacterium]